MPESVAVAAPAAPATPAPAAKEAPTNPFEAPKGAKAPPKADAAPAQAEEPKPDPKAKWRDSLKDSPWKVKHKGEEKALADFDPEELTSLAQRGYGATKLAEEANKKAAEADKVLAVRRAIEEGDDEAALDAILSIGGKRGVALLQKLQAQQSERESALKDVPPEVRALVEQNEAMQRQLREFQQAQESAKRAEAEKAQQALVEKTRSEAQDVALSVVKALKLPEGMVPAMVPHVARAMREALEVGLELGQDVPPERIAARAQELAQASVFGVLDSLPEAQLYEALGPDRVAKLAREHLTRHRMAKQPQAAAAPAKRAPEPTTNVFKLGDPRYILR